MVRLLNPSMRFLVGRLGLGLRGRRVLEVRGRKSGRWRATPVNVLALGGERYLVILLNATRDSL